MLINSVVLTLMSFNMSCQLGFFFLDIFKLLNFHVDIFHQKVIIFNVNLRLYRNKVSIVGQTVDCMIMVTITMSMLIFMPIRCKMIIQSTVNFLKGTFQVGVGFINNPVNFSYGVCINFSVAFNNFFSHNFQFIFDNININSINLVKLS